MTEAMEVGRGNSGRDDQVEFRDQLVKGRTDCGRSNGPLVVFSKREQGAILRDRSQARFSASQKAGEFLRHSWPKGDKPILSKLRLADQKNRLIDIHVFAA